MKTNLRTLVLVVLVAVMSVSTCVAVMAAEDIPPAGGEIITYEDEALIYEAREFRYDEEMNTYSGEAATRSLRNPDDDDGTRLGGSRTSNIENAPALRYDQSVVIPRVDLTPDEEPETTLESETVYSPPPQTGVLSFGSLFALGFALIGSAGVTAQKGGKERRAR